MTLRPDAAKPGTPVILGVPFDANSSWLRGAAGAPPIIRVAFNSISSNFVDGNRRRPGRRRRVLRCRRFEIHFR